eukprot:gb/GEZN01005653.1/.p1 GENE.gb/GEZN01005653.1/~~gb/GEZN01005653.1/.p1  ORF type:complete len:436 (+),score=58.85 gb/GEZN01005653.1/:162-1310(+)
MSAAGNGLINVVEILIDRKANMDLQDKSGNTALIKAAGNGKTSTVTLLVASKASINIRNNENDTALIWSTRRKHEDTVRELLRLGADMSVLGSGDKTVLDRGKESSPAIASLLLEHEVGLAEERRKLFDARTPRTRAKEHRESVEHFEAQSREEEEKKQNARHQAEEWVIKQRLAKKQLQDEDRQLREAAEKSLSSSPSMSPRTSNESSSVSPRTSNDSSSVSTPSTSESDVQVTPPKRIQGVVVGVIEPNSAAYKAGLKTGDIITHVNGTAIRHPQDMVARVGASTEHEFTVHRGGNTLKIRTPPTPDPHVGETQTPAKNNTPPSSRNNTSSTPPATPPASGVGENVDHSPLSPMAYKRYISEVQGKHIERLRSMGLVNSW